jgi:hypothetical protein
MASPDFYQYAAQQRAAELEAQKAQALADLAQYKAANDYQGAAGAVQQIANLEAERNNLAVLHDQYVRSQTPVAPPELTAEEKAAKPWDKMTWEDGLDLARTSKYGADLTHDNPNVQAGYREVMARRARGE